MLRRRCIDVSATRAGAHVPSSLPAASPPPPPASSLCRRGHRVQEPSVHALPGPALQVLLPVLGPPPDRLLPQVLPPLCGGAGAGARARAAWVSCALLAVRCRAAANQASCAHRSSPPSHLISSSPCHLQDVGLIFLSAMATSIAGICSEAGRDAAAAVRGAGVPPASSCECGHAPAWQPHTPPVTPSQCSSSLSHCSWAPRS